MPLFFTVTCHFSASAVIARERTALFSIFDEGHAKIHGSFFTIVQTRFVFVSFFKQVRPPLNKKLFPVHRPGGLKRAFLFHVIKKNFFLLPPVHSSL